ncbi:MAG: Holliday junction resolvase RuvX [Chloroflexia bacterium]
MEAHDRLLGLDVGRRRIGAALSDPSGLLASPLGVIELRGAGEGQAEVCAWVRAYGVARVIVGLPLHLDGSEGEEAAWVREWAERLQARLDIPVELWDERLSTVAAERNLRESGMGRKRRRERRDAVAAALILQSYLDARRSPHPT